jgi:sterol desaturase/sphingolipid hydroxylase (fatty acid hydroxylase superfamily)
LNSVFVVAFFLLIDVITFWKHWLLHQPMFFVFHQNHHSFGNPTSFASFAVSPFETFLTFGPALFDVLPITNIWVRYLPLQLGVVFFFFVLNVYLHCGYTFDWIERTFPRLFINTSGYHNVHHEKKVIHFSELLTLWDYLRNTGATYYNRDEF